ncbi:class II aldolase/adducin family protein [Mitsuokella sp. WILCCON 0060]|uniref:class II aldolase/adducin family protein n=1 Tax=unclassified Mitsuokella TaxID=2637239 RepID=UPI003EFDDDBA
MLERLKRQVVRYAQQAEREGLCRHRSGNFSIHDKETGYIVITPTGMDRAEMLPEDVVVIDMQGNVVEALTGKKPTSESMMHMAVYKARPEVGAIVHTHSKNATAFAVMNKPIPAIVYELFLLGCKKGYIPVAPYGRPGTKELAESVLKPLSISDVALMQAHGVIAVAGDLKEALLRASYVEELAEIYYKTLTVLGHEPDVVPVEELANWKYPGRLS